MGGDNAPGEIVKGAVSALSQFSELKIYLAGREELITPCLNGLEFPRERLEIIHASEVISGSDNPGLSIRSKKNASMVVALKMVGDGNADAVVTAGNTGALMAGALLFLGRIPGVARPALLTTFPVLKGDGVVILDVGANMNARPEQLVQYALMGKVYVREVLKRKAPRIALLNVGSEENKGNEQVKKAYELFCKHVPGFTGNIEGNQVLMNTADIIVCDGFVGNVFLKTAEGVSMGLLKTLKDELETGSQGTTETGALMQKLREFRKKVDHSEYGGAPLIGVKGICIKCHGSSGEKAVHNAIVRQVYPLVRKQVTKIIEEMLIKSNFTRKDFSCKD